jgi:hypothetical protein
VKIERKYRRVIVIWVNCAENFSLTLVMGMGRSCSPKQPIIHQA